jgi:hypothetical protein
MLAGPEQNEKFKEAFSNAKICVVVATEFARRSEYVLSEIAWAGKQKCIAVWPTVEDQAVEFKLLPKGDFSYTRLWELNDQFEGIAAIVLNRLGKERISPKGKPIDPNHSTQR